MPNIDWEDEDIPDGVDPKTAPVLITKRKPVTPPADTTGLRYNGKAVVRIEMQPVAVFADGSKVLL